MIEYSVLPASWTTCTYAQGQPLFWAGSTATHLFDLEFLARNEALTTHSSLPYHVARKKVPHVNAGGDLIKPSSPNGLKFEMFIFDILPRAERWTAVEIARAEEYMPL